MSKTMSLPWRESEHMSAKTYWLRPGEIDLTLRMVDLLPVGLLRSQKLSDITFPSAVSNLLTGAEKSSYYIRYSFEVNFLKT